MVVMTIPGGVCATLHADFTGATSGEPVRVHIRGAVKAMIEGAIQSGLDPLPLPSSPEPGLSFNISFPAALDRVLRQRSRTQGGSIAEAAMGFLYAALARGDAAAHRASSVVSAIAPYVAAAGHSMRIHQALFFDCLDHSLVGDDKQSRRIGLIEGATGLGKTLAVVSAAAQALKNTGARRIVVATPTIQLLRAYVDQHRKLEAVLPDFPVKRVVLGRNEFVCVADLKTALQEGRVACDPAPILSWLDGGGAAAGTGQVFALPYLCSSLEAVSPGFPAAGVRLNQDSDVEDPAALSYASQFECDAEDDTPEILYCTHAMLGVDIRRRMAMVNQSEAGRALRDPDNALLSDVAQLARDKMIASDSGDADEARRLGLSIRDHINHHIAHQAAVAIDNDFGHLPPWQLLIIDEAHQFETNLAGILASNLSIVSYLRLLKQLAQEGSISKRALSSALKALRKLGEITPDEETQEKGVDLTAGGRTSLTAQALLAEMAEAFCSAKAASASQVAYKARRMAKDIKRALQMANSDVRGMRIRLEFSPVRAFPQLTYGRESVNKELRFLWATARAVACVSATLYLRRLDRDSGAYMASILNIPRDRLQEYPPIRPEWTYTPVTGLWTPEKKMVADHLWLCPPSRSDKLDPVAHQRREQIWLDEVADAVREIVPGAAGGALILMTSYSSAAELGDRLQPHFTDLVVASPDSTLAKQRESFVSLAGAGKHPVWIAVGGAWTGLDVNGHEFGLRAEDDNLITDLIIPRLPFRLNRSLTHHRRLELGDTPWELLDTSMRFKQGLGRLVRREGLPKNRRIHVLDARIHADNMSNYLAPLTRIMAAYPQKVLRMRI